MSRRRPTSLTVLGQRLAIEYVKAPLDLDETQGFYDPSRRLIRVLDEEGWEATLFHELVHAVLSITGHTETLGEKAEEAIVRALEHGLAPLVRFR